MFLDGGWGQGESPKVHRVNPYPQCSQGKSLQSFRKSKQCSGTLLRGGRDATTAVINEESTDAPSSSTTTFVPTRKKAKKMKKEEMLADAIKKFHQQHTGSSDLVRFLEEDGKNQREHEQKLMEMQLERQRHLQHHHHKPHHQHHHHHHHEHFL